MKGKIRFKILEFISEAAQTADDILFAFSLPYGTSLSRMLYLTERRRDQKERIISIKIDKRIKRNFNDFFYRLKKDNLISDTKEKKGYFQLTPKGKESLEMLRLNYLPVYKYNISKNDDGALKIIIFDIPEKESRKRLWLRCALRNLNFKMIQKSVWVGKANLPQQFIKDLEQIDILLFIEIFSITKKGSLKHLEINQQ
jgi:DNA-binding PadR family transcriptional regulator